MPVYFYAYASSVPVRKASHRGTQVPHTCLMISKSTTRHIMKIIYTKQNAKGGYNEVGMTDRGLTSAYSTTSGFIRYGIPANFYGNTLRLEVWYGDSIHGDADKTMYVTV